MQRLTWWFRLVGLLYVLLGIVNTPPLMASALPMFLPPGSPLPGGLLKLALDLDFMFGLDLLVTGLFLLWASRNPLAHTSVVLLVVALEAVRGIADDLYMIASGYEPAEYVVFILLHATIIATGLAFVRQARRAPGVATASA